MNLVLFTHPDFLGSQSHPHFARMLSAAFAERGHHVQLRQPQAVVRQWLLISRWTKWAKWAGYVDQYLIFPRVLRRQAAKDPADTLYVFCDQALGPWVPLLAERPHVVHCHDLLALRSALGLLPENPTSFTGRIYQRYIRAGFGKARHFISVSKKSRDDLHEFGRVQPQTSEVVYNGLNYPYQPMSAAHAAAVLQQAGLPAQRGPVLLHVGGGQWYKNTAGVVWIYVHYVHRCVALGRSPLPLWLVSPAPGAAVQAALHAALRAVPAAGSVRFFQGLSNPVLQALYASAAALLFPSLAEGFGWPIIEAMACACPVITTCVAPMTEVGGEHAFYLPRPQAEDDLSQWGDNAAVLLMQVLDRPPQERARAAQAGVEWTARFDCNTAIDNYLRIYQSVLANFDVVRSAPATASSTPPA
jgi:glycosyltransferase involved in cell wall biosynthesis